jgi:hypothetical protein
MAGKKFGLWWALKAAFFAVFFAGYGILHIIVSAIRLVRRFIWGVRLLGDSVPCPYCKRPVPLVGRFICSSPGCGAEYHGFIQSCNICGSGCLWTPCPACNAAVQVGMRI